MLSYAASIRREIHMRPGIGFELDDTLAILRRELSDIGVEYTEKYGKSSIVATVNPEKSHFTIGIRADMDALPITEECDVPYKSLYEGKMHACGHDAHTAIALATLKRIYEMREKISCRVKFIFQAAEEYAPSGAMLMARDGVMDEIDCIVGLHCAPGDNTGKVGIIYGPKNATSDGFYLDFFGKSSHAAAQQSGVDAIMMAVRAYTDIEFMIAKAFPAKSPIIFNVGAIHGGEANNIISSECRMFCTLRTWSDEDATKAIEGIKKIIAAVADTAGGRATFTQAKHYPIIMNNETLTAKVEDAASKVVGKENILYIARSMGGEDFSYFANLKPGCHFNLGTKHPDQTETHGVHTSRFDIDEDALDIGVDIMTQFVLDNQGGIKF
ncbi:MAG: amidohydrolase [Clostridia bacterium]|nr:amidohydrolase [Clostridia bacterium]